MEQWTAGQRFLLRRQLIPNNINLLIINTLSHFPHSALYKIEYCSGIQEKNFSNVLKQEISSFLMTLFKNHIHTRNLKSTLFIFSLEISKSFETLEYWPFFLSRIFSNTAWTSDIKIHFFSNFLIERFEDTLVAITKIVFWICGYWISFFQIWFKMSMSYLKCDSLLLNSSKDFLKLFKQEIFFYSIDCFWLWKITFWMSFLISSNILNVYSSIYDGTPNLSSPYVSNKFDNIFFAIFYSILFTVEYRVEK